MATSPSTREVQAYWNDIGNLEELWRSNMDAVAGAVRIDPGASEVVEGVRAGAGTDLAGTEVEPPALFGPNVELADDVRVDGPAVIGDGARIGAGSRIKERWLLPGPRSARRPCWPVRSSPSALPERPRPPFAVLRVDRCATGARRRRTIWARDAIRQLLSAALPSVLPACGASCPGSAFLCRRCQASLDATRPPAVPELAGLDGRLGCRAP